MFLVRKCESSPAAGFPRMRGDVPLGSYRPSRSAKFSPHARGCSPAPGRWNPTGLVFPACAGMFPRVHGLHAGDKRFPRMRRGCSETPLAQNATYAVFPAYAGMFRLITSNSGAQPSFPHIRGDVPITSIIPAWAPVVFPAHAEMFPCKSSWLRPPPSFPRIRGDVPAAAVLRNVKIWFSPHTRGYSRGKACNEEDSSEKI